MHPRIHIALHLSCIAIVLCGFAAKAQEIGRGTKLVGSYLPENRDLYASVYDFPGDIEHLYLDAANGVLQVVYGQNHPRKSRRKGVLLEYDLRVNQVLWSKKIRYSNNAIYGLEGLLVETPGKNTIGFDSKTGKKLWKAPHDLYFVDEPHRVGVGYLTNGPKDDHYNLEGIDLLTGTSMWKRRVFKGYGWNDLQNINDSTYLIIAAGLHKLDIRTGEGWSYNALTVDDSKRFRAPEGYGLGGGIFMKGGMISNVLTDSSDYYLAGKTKIVRIDALTGKVKWSSTLPEGITGASSIFLKDSSLYMVNRGMALTTFGPITHGEPFIASFNQRSGHPRYLKATQSEELPIWGMEIIGESLFLLNKEGMERYSLASGELEAHNQLDEELDGKALAMLRADELYHRQSDGRYEALADSEGLFFLITSHGLVMAINEDLQRVYSLSAELLWEEQLSVSGMKLLSDGERSLLIDEEGVLLSEILLPGTVSAAQDRHLLFRKDNRCFMIDLQSLHTGVLRGKK